MRGTFYVVSGLVGDDGYMSWSQVRGLAAGGNEIAGHTVLHAKLTTVDASEAQREVCNDRSNLISQGFSPQNFAYPNGATNTVIEGIVEDCGYNSARGVGGLYSPPPSDCSSGCPVAETPAPRDRYAIRTPDPVNPSTTLDGLKAEVQGSRVGEHPRVYDDVEIIPGAAAREHYYTIREITITLTMLSF
jgi:peptidoglycan/xylan/chitin deacetylase (PgdA/CDA1 family)